MYIDDCVVGMDASQEVRIRHIGVGGLEEGIHKPPPNNQGLVQGDTPTLLLPVEHRHDPGTCAAMTS